METMKENAMDFSEYYETGEETPDSLLDGDYISTEDIVNVGSNSLSSTDKNIFEGRTDINEGLVDVIFKTIKTNMKVSVQGNLIYFKWEWLLNKTFFSIRVRKTTFDGFVEWVNKIKDYADEE